MLIKVLSNNDFNKMCVERGIDDSNVEMLENDAFISIIGTTDDSYDMPGFHHFMENHPNVLNLEFDDVENDINIGGYSFKAITDEQADKLVQFIIENKGKNFYIHCLAGISRSGAVGSFIYDFFNDECEIEFEHRPKLRPNIEVLSKLKKSYWYKNFK